MRVLFVCTGNVCRSPMAEAFLLHEAGRRGLDLSVRSTGTHAWDGRAATIDGRRIMSELGVPMDRHRAARLDDELIDWADLVVCLAREHVLELEREFPRAAEKTFLLKELVALLPDVEAGDDLVADLHRARGEAEPVVDTDVDDPFGEREAAYRRVATEIRDLVEQLAEGLERVRRREATA